MNSQAFVSDRPAPREGSPDPPRPAGFLERPDRADESGALRALAAAAGSAESPLPLRDWIDRAEAWYIVRTLDALRGNRSATARALGIGRRTLYAKMQKLGIEARWHPEGRPAAPAE